MRKDELAEIMGFVPNKELRLHVLKYAKDHNIPLGQAASMSALPPMFIADDQGLIDTPLGKMTPEAYDKTRSPWARIIVIKRRGKNGL